MKQVLAASRHDDAGREAVLLENGLMRAVIDRQGGMMPEFSVGRGSGWLNLHWIPHFRGAGGSPWSAARHEAFWKARLLYELAGDFPCAPNFGAGCEIDGRAMPPHGQAANEAWKLDGLGKDGRRGAAWARFSLVLRDKALPLTLHKYDLAFEGQRAFYSLLRIENRGKVDLDINLGRHATLGSPFLQAGCLLSVGADRFMTAPAGSEFDGTGRLAQGVEFPSLAEAPLREGGTVDLGFVPGPVGATDLVIGAVPRAAELGWSCVVNPVLDLAHLAFFPGPASLPPDEVAPSFNILWMQYGGRRFTPWASGEGGTDLSFCLGTEHAAAAFANGLAYARERPELLGAPTTARIPARSTRSFCYGSLAAELGGALRAPVKKVERNKEGLVLRSGRASLSVPADSGFERLRGMAARIDAELAEKGLRAQAPGSRPAR
jgi:hypothetical protein